MTCGRLVLPFFLVQQMNKHDYVNELLSCINGDEARCTDVIRTALMNLSKGDVYCYAYEITKVLPTFEYAIDPIEESYGESVGDYIDTHCRRFDDSGETVFYIHTIMGFVSQAVSHEAHQSETEDTYSLFVKLVNKAVFDIPNKNFDLFMDDIALLPWRTGNDVTEVNIDPAFGKLLDLKLGDFTLRGDKPFWDHYVGLAVCNRVQSCEEAQKLLLKLFFECTDEHLDKQSENPKGCRVKNGVLSRDNIGVLNTSYWVNFYNMLPQLLS